MNARRKVLVIGPELILQWTESTARALESLGCTVRTHFYNRSGLRRGAKGFRQYVFRRIGLALPDIPQPLLRRYGAWLAARTSRMLLDEARAFKPDLILVLKGESLRAETLQALKVQTEATMAVWWVDHPFMNAETRHPWQEVPACIPFYDCCFVFDRAYEAELRTAGAKLVRFLPCAADPTLFNPQRLTNGEQVAYGANVSLIGVYTESRSRVVRALSQEPGLGIWGPGWQACLSSGEGTHGQAFRGESLPPSDACKVYNASLVNLNTHHHQSQNTGLNTRAFEIPAAGAFELTDHVPGMETLLEPGREVGVYRSPEEAAELTRYFIKTEGERRRIAEAGHRRVMGEHTYRHRMEALLASLA